MKRPIMILTATLAAATMLAGCSTGGSTSSASAKQAKGPITIWYSNNPDEVTWGKATVASWNAANPKEKVTGQEIPAGTTSEAVIGAAITAGTTPCLIYNTAPVAVPAFQKQGGLVDLSTFPDGAKYIKARSGATAAQYASADGDFYQMPWKSNPVMVFYNKAIMKKAGIDPANPPLATYDQFLATSRAIVTSGAAKYAVYPSPASDYFQSWFDFYAMYAAESGGKQLLENGKSTFTNKAGTSVANFWRTVYKEKLAGNEPYTGDAFADGITGMALAGPWAIKSYKSLDWGVAPIPTSAGTTAAKTHTFADSKNIGMYSSCKATGTAWDFLKYSTSKTADGALLTTTGQMPLRTNLPTTYPAYFKANPTYTMFADAASRTVEVPNISNSVEAWQAFRDAWTKSVIFGEGDVTTSLKGAATAIDKLAAQK